MRRLPHLTFACLLLASPVLAQTDEEWEFKPIDEHVEEAAPAPNDAQAEARELFRRVEKRLREIDELLNDASAGQTGGLSKLSESGIGDLVKRSRTSSKSAIKDIDRLLEILNQP